MPTHKLPAKLVWYVEMHGDKAHTELQTFLAGLTGHAGFISAELLTSPAQPGLMLAASRWVSVVPDISVPAQAKSWVFEVVEEERFSL